MTELCFSKNAFPCERTSPPQEVFVLAQRSHLQLIMTGVDEKTSCQAKQGLILSDPAAISAFFLHAATDMICHFYVRYYTMFPILANCSRDVVLFLQMVLQLFTWCWLIMTLYRMALRFIESLVGGVQLGQTLTEGLGKDLFLEEVPWPPPPNLAFPPSRLLVIGCRPPPSGLEIPCLEVCDGGSS